MSPSIADVAPTAAGAPTPAVERTESSSSFQHRPPRVLIANRGEIARRVIRTCRLHGVETLSVYTQPDALAPHAREATAAVCLGPNPRGYTDAKKLLRVALEYGATAVHPGYGFLSENAEFCAAVEAAGIAWLGPTAQTMNDFALKHVAREIAERAGVPVLKGSGLVATPEEAVAAADAIGYPVLLKATGGGGGRGIYVCADAAEVAAQFGVSQKQGEAFFGNAGVFVEKYIARCHHIEVQIFGDGAGGVVALGERECSIQRRHQKVLEETPSPLLSDAQRADLVAAATRLGAAARYRSAGTVEFIFDEDEGRFYFLEVNTRLQVEHGITELVHGGVDLVEWMLRLQVPGLAPLDLASLTVERSGHAIELRLNGEDPARDFQPCPGTLGEVHFPTDMDGVRVDTWVEPGAEVSPHYDSLLGKLMVWAPTRALAVERIQKAIDATRLRGAPNNVEFLRALVRDPRFVAGSTTTSFLEAFSFRPRVVEVVLPGLQTSVQDWPGRKGLWRVGVPPSGPMDALAHRVANALVGNAEDAAALEFGLTGPTLRFHRDALVALAGARFDAALDGAPLPDAAWWSSFEVRAGQELAIGSVRADSGVRGYLAVAGGVDVPLYLGSRATFPGGKFGGYQGRCLRPGDSLPIGEAAGGEDAGAPRPTALPAGWLERFAGAVQPSAVADGAAAAAAAPGDDSSSVATSCSTGGANGGAVVIGVLPGPHANPDYLTDAAAAEFYSAPYEVHYNSNRLGVRLNGPRPTWARADGGEGGSHPSNVHDHTYAVGAVNFTGDMPVVLTVDGPSLGGFVCPATIPSSELWKVGQLRPHDSVRFQALSIADAYAAALRTDALVAAVRALARGEAEAGAAEAALAAFAAPALEGLPPTRAVLVERPASGGKAGGHPGFQIRLAGDRCVQIEYGPMELDLALRARVHALEKRLAEMAPKGLVETCAGVRSCMVEYEQRELPLPALLAAIEAADASIGDVSGMVLPSRVVHLPMAFDERWSRDALERYAKSVRPEAPYLPSNVDYVAANNGLASAEDVRRVVFEASYLVLGLGDVYLGAPCAVPVNPLHRLVTTKMNPARTFTHEGTVGIGGAYMCIYPMDSPGGYQLVGRTLPIWNTFGRTAAFTPAKPWLLEFFDQVRFFQVSEAELEALRERFAAGQYELSVEATSFSVADYTAMVNDPDMAEAVAAWKAQQRAAMAEQLKLEEESLARLEAAKAAAAASGASSANPSAHGGAAFAGLDGGGAGAADDPAWDAPGVVKVAAGFTANVWDVKVKAGDAVAKGDTLLVLEAMKMESPVAAPVSGVVRAVVAEQGALAAAGQLLLVIEAAAAADGEEEKAAAA